MIIPIFGNSFAQSYAVFRRGVDGKVWNAVANAWEVADPDNKWNGSTSEYHVYGNKITASTNDPNWWAVTVPTHANFGGGRIWADILDRAGGTPDAMSDSRVAAFGDYSGHSFWYDGAEETNGPPQYWADIQVAQDTEDEWRFFWYRNTTLVQGTAGKITVTKTGGLNADLVAQTAATADGSFGWYFNSATQMAAAEAYKVEVRATIDGVERTFHKMFRAA